MVQALCIMHAQNNVADCSSQKETWITVFIHGMMSIKHHITFSNFIRFLYDDVEDCVYSTTIKFMRSNEYFYQNQAMQSVGFCPIYRDMKRGNGAGAFAYTLERMSELYGLPQHNNYYYTFGWCGLLSAKARYSEAAILFDALEQEVERFKRNGITPKIRIFAYSHGGNVALNLGAVRQLKKQNSSLVVDQLILIGMPVQTETESFVNDPVFKQVFNVYSKGDRVQQLDLFSAKRIFSDYMFRKKCSFVPSSKIIQVQLKVTVPTCAALRDDVLFDWTNNFDSQRITVGRSYLLKDMSPGHAELWFFGWTPLNYRNNFPLYPLPAAAFIPILVEYINKNNIYTSPQVPMIFDIRPKNDRIILRSYGTSRALAILPLCPTSELNALHSELLNFAPRTYCERQYRQYIRDAYEQALLWHKGQLKGRRNPEQQFYIDCCCPECIELIQ